MALSDNYNIIVDLISTKMIIDHQKDLTRSFLVSHSVSSRSHTTRLISKASSVGSL